MFDSLFRQAAVDAQRDRLMGEVLVMPALHHRIIALLLVIWCSLVLCWVFVGSYARQETVRGWLEPDDGMVRVYPHASQGQVQKLLVSEGEEVQSGQPLMVISTPKVNADGEEISSNQLALLQKQKASLDREAERNQTIHALELVQLEQQLSATDSAIKNYRRQLALLDKRRQLVSHRLSQLESMVSAQHVSQLEVDSLKDQGLAMDGDYQRLENSLSASLSQHQQLSAQLALLPQQQLTQQAGLQRSIHELEQRLTQLRGQSKYVLHASRDGVIANLQAVPGQPVAAGQPLMSIIPANQSLQLRLLVPVRAAGFVAEGQSLKVRYDAFPFQKFGLYRGSVTAVGGAVMLPGEVYAAPVAVSEPVYLVKGQVSDNQVKAFGTRLRLKAGMTLSADIKLGERSIFAWLVEPILSLKGRL